ncbi:MAG: hypothetical protein OK404_01235 [Thaumarchaeota archaeon]|nr:hypothetical protein [Nitrososphaerota archaeon]
MQTFDLSLSCPECSQILVDAFDELVCPDCGIVQDKEVVELQRSRPLTANDFTRQALGSYLGSPDGPGRERFSKIFSKSHSNYGYLKLVSDFVGRDDTSTYDCLKLVERVSDSLGLPRVVMARAVVIAKKLLASRKRGRRVTSATVSAFALIVSCRVDGALSVGTREILEAHQSLGKRVKVSSIIRLSLDSQIRAPARGPEDFLSKVLAKLSQRPAMLLTLRSQGVGIASYTKRLRELATEILALVGEDLKAGHRPSALAATAIYASELVLAERESRPRRISQKEVAECGDVAEYTVREQYRQIFNPSLQRAKLGLMQGPPAQLLRRIVPQGPRSPAGKPST